MTATNLGVNYKDAGRLKEGLALLEQTYRSGADIPTIRILAGPQLLDGYLQSKKGKQAVKLTRELLVDATTYLPRNSPQLASYFAQVGHLLLHSTEFAAADRVLRQCLTIRQKTSPDSWLTFNTQSMLGGVLLKQGSYTSAEKLLVAGFEGMKKREAKIPAGSRVQLTAAIERLVKLYAAMGNKNKAEEFRSLLKSRSSRQPSK